MFVAASIAVTATTSATALPNDGESLNAQAEVCHRVAEGRRGDVNGIIGSYATNLFDRFALSRRCKFYLQGMLDGIALTRRIYEPKATYKPLLERRDSRLREQMRVCRIAQGEWQALKKFELTRRDWSVQQKQTFEANCIMYQKGELDGLKG